MDIAISCSMQPLIIEHNGILACSSVPAYYNVKTLSKRYINEKNTVDKGKLFNELQANSWSATGDTAVETSKLRAMLRGELDPSILIQPTHPTYIVNGFFDKPNDIPFKHSVGFHVPGYTILTPLLDHPAFIEDYFKKLNVNYERKDLAIGVSMCNTPLSTFGNHSFYFPEHSIISKLCLNGGDVGAFKNLISESSSEKLLYNELEDLNKKVMLNEKSMLYLFKSLFSGDELFSLSDFEAITRRMLREQEIKTAPMFTQLKELKGKLKNCEDNIVHYTILGDTYRREQYRNSHDSISNEINTLESKISSYQKDTVTIGGGVTIPVSELELMLDSGLLERSSASDMPTFNITPKGHAFVHDMLTNFLPYFSLSTYKALNKCNYSKRPMSGIQARLIHDLLNNERFHLDYFKDTLCEELSDDSIRYMQSFLEDYNNSRLKRAHRKALAPVVIEDNSFWSYYTACETALANLKLYLSPLIKKERRTLSKDDAFHSIVNSFFIDFMDTSKLNMHNPHDIKLFNEISEDIGRRNKFFSLFDNLRIIKRGNLIENTVKGLNAYGAVALNNGWITKGSDIQFSKLASAVSQIKEMPHSFGIFQNLDIDVNFCPMNVCRPLRSWMSTWSLSGVERRRHYGFISSGDFQRGLLVFSNLLGNEWDAYFVFNPHEPVKFLVNYGALVDISIEADSFFKSYSSKNGIPINIEKAELSDRRKDALLNILSVESNRNYLENEQFYSLSPGEVPSEYLQFKEDKKGNTVSYSSLESGIWPLNISQLKDLEDFV